MSDQMIENDADLLAMSNIEAEVAWTVSNRPPEVVLSFEGLHEPTSLWTKLTAIGWDIPQMPPRPANAIEWTPDPVAGTDFTVLPWRVTDFRLGDGTWTVEEDQVGAQTLDALLDSGATIVGTSEQITEHAKTYEARKSQRQQSAENPIQTPQPVAESVAPAPVAATNQAHGIGVIPNPVAEANALVDQGQPAAAPVPAQVASAAEQAEVPSIPGSSTASRFILLLDFPLESDPLPTAGTWKGVSGRQRAEATWSELCISQDEAIPGHQDMANHVAKGAGAWYADTETEVAGTAGVAGKRIVRLFVPDLKVNDAKIRRMNKLLGDEIETHQLRSLIGGQATAVLVSATVNSNSFEMLKSNLALRMPKAIVRIPS